MYCMLWLLAPCLKQSAHLVDKTPRNAESSGGSCLLIPSQRFVPRLEGRRISECMRRHSIVFLIAALAGLAVPPAMALGEASPPFRFYSVYEGLNQRLVQAFAQDEHGLLWFATWGGLNRFDGTRFESITASQGLGVNGATVLLVDQHNRVWVGDTGGGGIGQISALPQ